MIDEDDSSPVEVAARELGEETKLTVTPDDIQPLFSKPLYSATATSDEALHFFYVEQRMPLAAIKAMNGQQTGEEGENEHTQLKVATFPEAHGLASNIHSVMGHLLYLQRVGDYNTMKLLPAYVSQLTSQPKTRQPKEGFPSGRCRDTGESGPVPQKWGYGLSW